MYIPIEILCGGSGGSGGARTSGVDLAARIATGRPAWSTWSPVVGLTGPLGRSRCPIGAFWADHGSMWGRFGVDLGSI